MSAPEPMGMPDDPFPDLTLMELTARQLNQSPAFWDRLIAQRAGSRLALVEIVARDREGEPTNVRIIA